ncbi:MAG: NUDIX domain-containing protein [bacterium]|nr:NUDIX domain-containing protein [bacterium]
MTVANDVCWDSENEKRPYLAVDAVIFKKHKDKLQVLLGKRGKGIAGAGKWHVPGGHVKEGEKLTEAVKREVREETGLEIVIDQIVWIEENFDNNRHHVTIDIACWLEGKQEPKNLEPRKCDGWQWFDLDNLPTPLWKLAKFFPVFRQKRLNSIRECFK